jgi:hypothetical protein
VIKKERSGLFAAQIYHRSPFRRAQIPGVISHYRRAPEPLVGGNATALQSKQQSGYSAKPQGENPKGCAP